VAARGEEGIEKVRELTDGDGTHTVLECVGLEAAIDGRPRGAESAHPAVTLATRVTLRGHG
jgi:hypothetical protein